MRISIIDPSLFTIPYDRELIGGLTEGGHIVRLHGRPVTAEDNDTGNVALTADFYRASASNAFTVLPRPIRQGIKGIDHYVSLLRLAARFRAEPPDIIHFQWLPLPLVDQRFLARFRDIAPLVLTVHDTTPNNGDPGTIRAHGFHKCLEAFDQLIVHTEQGRRRLVARGIPEAKITVLPLGLTESLPQSRPVQMDGPLTLLMFGKIKPYKGLDVLIEAFALLSPETRAQASMRVVGKSYMPLEPLQALAKARGVADKLVIDERFVPDSDVNEVFTSCTIAVFPYRDIEASAVLPIAFANSCPIVASALGSFSEQIEDGVQGLLVPPGDSAALAAALTRMIGDRAFAVRCGEQSRLVAESTTDWPEVGRRTTQIYDEARRLFESRRRKSAA